MPFRNRLSRMMRKSGSSSGSSSSRGSDGHAEPYKVSSNLADTTQPMPSTPTGLKPYTSASSRFTKKPAWLSNNASPTNHDDVRPFSPSPTHKPTKKRSAKSAPKHIHPSERPLNEQNLRHQEILGRFTMKFGRSRRFSHGARSNFSGISPCHSRTASMDICRSAGPEGDDDDDDDDEGPYGPRRRSSLVGGPAEQERIAEEDS